MMLKNMNPGAAGGAEGAAGGGAGLASLLGKFL